VPRVYPTRSPSGCSTDSNLGFLMKRLTLLVLAVAALAGCGQSNPDLIPASNAQALQQTADKITQACSNEDRSEARAQVRLAQREIEGLPRGVDPDLKKNLQAWIDQIQSRITQDCRAAATPTPTAAETPTEAPTQEPSATPTDTPTQAPTDTPTPAPTQAPTETPPAVPTEAPTAVPTPAIPGDVEG
jgi:predicted small lipoprotein YifL